MAKELSRPRQYRTAVIGAVLAWRVTANIVVPLHEAAKFAESVATGDLTRRIAPASNDEIGNLMRALGNMSAGLVEIVNGVRSGEQGRGFAVVASEVRQLAQRCTTAAHEIKQLIHASVTKIADGTLLVDQSGATMKELLGSVQNVNVLIERIAAASDHQAESVREINTAVDHVDNLTQQNASLVEQAAAAAESMHEQANALARQVMVFRVA